MSEHQNETEHSRRDVVKGGAAVAVGAAFTVRFGRLRPLRAAGSDEIRVGLVGAGGRGYMAALQALKAAPGVRLVAVGEAFKDRLDSAVKRFNEDAEVKGKIDLPPERQFLGLDAYQKVIATDANYIILATPPGFRPVQLKAAIAAGKNVFTEKPVAVDGPGIRTCFEVADEAKKKNLAIGVGLQRRHQRGYLETMKRVQGGAIGDIVGGRCYWMQSSLWIKPRQATWSDLEWQMRNWLYFAWLSGDHIVEQHIHNIDVINWGMGGKHPVAAVAMGGRQQRVQPEYGHVYDHFAVDFEYPNDVHVSSYCRQIPGCENNVSEHLVGTKGRVHTDNKNFKITTRKTWIHEPDKDPDAYQQEHTDLITSIRKGKPLNELKSAAESNLAAIMGRMSGYTGKRVTWEQALNSKEILAPELDWKRKMPVAAVAIPGTSDVI